jgi:hypothetical protein
VTAACATCTQRARDGGDALALALFEVLETSHNPCAPITSYVVRCRSCQARWRTIEVFDEDGVRPSEWSWSFEDADPPRDDQ